MPTSVKSDKKTNHNTAVRYSENPISTVASGLIVRKDPIRTSRELSFEENTPILSNNNTTQELLDPADNMA